MSENNFDICILKEEGGWLIEVDYWHFSRGEKKVMTSKTTYSWRTSCSELVDNFQNGKRTKVFYSQLRVLTKKYGTIRKEKYNFVRNLKTA